METIKTKMRLLRVDESAVIQQGDWRYDSTDNSIKQWDGNLHSNRLTSYKIIAAHPPLQGCYEFETLPPNIEDDVDKLAKEFAIKIQTKEGTISRLNAQEWFKAGYKQGKSETRFSEAVELIKYFVYRVDKGEIRSKTTYDKYKSFLESLNKPKEWEFVPEMEEILGDEGIINIAFGESDRKHKVINNKIQGTWKLKQTN